MKKVTYFEMGAKPPQNVLSKDTTGKGSYGVTLGSYKLPPIRLISDEKDSKTI